MNAYCSGSKYSRVNCVAGKPFGILNIGDLDSADIIVCLEKQNVSRSDVAVKTSCLVPTL